MAWLDDNPPRTQQFRCPRRETPSGIIGVHTAESFPDETGPDTGAENVARFIRDRTNYGSYHDLADSDSIINLVRYECVAYHIGTHGFNEHTYGVSAATQAAKWDQLGDDWVDATVRNMARASARFAKWIKVKHGVTIPARRITLAQALRGEKGFLAHGDADPDRRTDPGSTFPWSLFLKYYAEEMGGQTMSWSTQLNWPTWMENRFNKGVGGKTSSASGLQTNTYGYVRQSFYWLRDSITYRIEGKSVDSKSSPRTVWKWTRIDARAALLSAKRCEVKLDAVLAALTSHDDAQAEVIRQTLADSVVTVDINVTNDTDEPVQDDVEDQT